jgi:hypothetical protein
MDGWVCVNLLFAYVQWDGKLCQFIFAIEEIRLMEEGKDFLGGLIQSHITKKIIS